MGEGYQHSGMGTRTTVESLTNIQHIPTSACIEAQWRMARRAILRFELFDVLVETRFMGYVAAGELKNPLAAKCVFQRLLAYCTLAADECPLPPCPTAVRIQHSRHSTTGSLAQIV
jgi:hypothetical protein